MDTLTTISAITSDFSQKLQENSIKYKKEKEELKKIIAETARSQAQKILEDESEDNMGNPDELCNKLAELRLQYNSIIVRQKEETDKLMNDYANSITLSLIKVTKQKHVVEKALIFDKFCYRGFNLGNMTSLTSVQQWPRTMNNQRVQIGTENRNRWTCQPHEFLANYIEVMNIELEKLTTKQ